MQPRQSSFHDPTINTQTTAVLNISASNQGLDRPVAQRLTMGLRVIAAIRIELCRAATGVAPQATHGWDRVNNWQQLGDVTGICGSHRSSERNALRIRNNVVFRAPSRSFSIFSSW